MFDFYADMTNQSYVSPQVDNNSSIDYDNILNNSISEEEIHQ